MNRNPGATRFYLPACGVLAIFLAGASAACDDERQVPAPLSDAAPAVEKSRSVRKSPGKTRAAIDIGFEDLRAATAGVAFDIDLRFVPRRATQLVEVRISAGEGLALVDGAAEDFIGLEAGATVVHRVRAIPQREGLAYLNVIATMITTDGRQVRTLAVPIRTGDQVRALESRARKEASGENVVSLPAVENR